MGRHSLERFALDHPEVADDGDQHLLDALVVQRATEVMMVDHVIAVVGAVHAALHGRVTRMTTLIARGTPPPMGDEALAKPIGYEAGHLEFFLVRAECP